MMRIAGILTGAALAVALLIVTIGIPDFVSDTQTMTTEPIILPLNRDSAATAAPAHDPALPDVPKADIEPLTSDGSAESSGEPAAPATDAEVVQAPLPDVPEPATGGPPGTVDELDVPAAPLPDADEHRWYAFWSPFRSELAAEGFVSQLQRVTGLDYRVVKVKTGVYEVAFAYADDADIGAYLSKISVATGLELPEG